MNSEKTFDVFLDNGIIRNTLLQNQIRRSEAFQRVISEQLKIVGHQVTNAHFISTPLMLIEYSGETLKPISLQHPNLKLAMSDLFTKIPFESNRIISELIQLLRPAMETHTITDYENLKTRLAQRRIHRCDYGKSLVDTIFLSNLERTETRSRFIDELVLDEIQGFDLREVYGSVERDDRITRISAALAAFLTHDTFNVALPRIVNQFYRMSPDGKTRSQTQSFDYDFSINHQDRADTQLIHFACVGHKRDASIFPVLCFTNEKWERTVKRAEAYLNYAIHLKHTLKDENINFRPGKIIQTSQETGQLLNELDLSVVWGIQEDIYLKS